MTENNRKQALILAGSEVLANHHGMAPGMIFTKMIALIFYYQDLQKS